MAVLKLPLRVGSLGPCHATATTAGSPHEAVPPRRLAVPTIILSRRGGDRISAPVLACGGSRQGAKLSLVCRPQRKMVLCIPVRSRFHATNREQTPARGSRGVHSPQPEAANTWV